MKLSNPKDAIGHKIVWHTWKDSYFIPEIILVSERRIYGRLYAYGKDHPDNFHLGDGIKTMSPKREPSYWYLIEELKIFKTSKLSDELFEI